MQSDSNGYIQWTQRRQSDQVWSMQNAKNCGIKENEKNPKKSINSPISMAIYIPQGIIRCPVNQVCRVEFICSAQDTDCLHSIFSTNAFNFELSLVAMKYVPPTSVQLTLLDQ